MILTAFIVLLGYEALMWGWTMNRHASWLVKHPEEEDRIPLVGYKRLRFISASSGLLSGLSTLGWIVLVAEHDFGVPHHGLMFGSAVLLIQLSHINLFAVIARYCCLPRSMWPLLSTWAEYSYRPIYGRRRTPIIFSRYTCLQVQTRSKRCTL